MLFPCDNLSALSAPPAPLVEQGKVKKKHLECGEIAKKVTQIRWQVGLCWSTVRTHPVPFSAFHLGHAFSRSTASHAPLLGWSLLGLDGCLLDRAASLGGFAISSL